VHKKEPVCYSLFQGKITFKSFASICYNFLKKSKSKNNIKTASNEKLLRAASQKIDFFRGEKIGFKRLN